MIREPAVAVEGAPGSTGARPFRRVKTFLEMVKFSHTVFALPFALCGLLLAYGGLPDPAVLGWVLAAMVGARTAAMGFNRLVDKDFDARNPRTADRALPRGVLSPGWVAFAVVLSVGLFAFACWNLNELCFLLAWPTLVVLFGYSLTKRFTSFSHFGLGLALGISPMGAWLARQGEFSAGWEAPLVLGLGVMFWVAGFDIIYACQDAEVDRQLGLHSLPVRFGKSRALQVAAWLHALTVGLLFAFGALAELGAFYYGAVGIVAVLLVVEHRMVTPLDLGRVNVAFFNINAAISLLVLGGVLADLLLPGALETLVRQGILPLGTTPDPLIIIGLMLVSGHLLGEIAHRARIPRITGYLAAGFLLGPSGLGVFVNPENAVLQGQDFLLPGEVMAQIALGLIVFTVGLQVDLWELLDNPRPILLACAESLLGGAAVAAGLVWFVGWDVHRAAVLGAVAMSSSPAVVILVRRELNADGPMVRRILATVGLNNLLSFAVFSFAFPLMAESLGRDPAYFWSLSLYRLLASAGVGVLLGAMLGWLEGALAKDLGIFLLRGGVVLAGLGISENLGLSPLLLLLTTGMAGECFARWKKRELLVDFGRVEVAFFIVLFVVSGSHIHLGHVLEAGAAGLVLVLGRVVGKAAGVFATGRSTDLPALRSQAAVSLCLVPMAGMALGLLGVLRASFPEDGPVAEVLALIVAAVAVFETVGPPLTRWGLLLTGEVPANAGEVEH